jgi:GTPase SAR1 family protein|nr:MAG TPA: AAA domain protein [Caudoviricetes sp.]
MARKFGEKREICIDPLAYNIGLIGESGIGKSTVIKEVCEKLVGDDGYIALDIGKEDGHDAINGIVSAKIPDWATFKEFCDDVIENKLTDYKDLRVVILDTFDQLLEITEPEVIRMHNRANPDKPKITSIKAAFGGFMAGEDKAIQLVLDKMWELKSVGVSFIAIGHTKKKDVDDPITGESYSILTTNMSQRYFNALKTKLHFLGVAYIDREIVKQKTGKKNIVTKEEEVKGRVLSESRRISFRDDNYSVDSKSRFADIVDEIPLDADAFIKALKDAILAEHSKGGKSVEQSEKELKEARKQQEKELAEKQKVDAANKIDEDRNAELLQVIQNKFPDADAATKKSVKEIMKEHDIPNFKNADDIPTAVLEQIVKVLNQE